MYQIFPDRFYRSGTTKYNAPQDRYLHQRWGSQPEWRPNHQEKSQTLIILADRRVAFLFA